MEEQIKIIKFIWEERTYKTIATVVLGGFLSLPVTVATLAFFYGGYIGSYYAKEAIKSEENPFMEN